MKWLKLVFCFYATIMSLLMLAANSYAASCSGGATTGGAPTPSLATPMVLTVKPNTPAPVVAKVVWTKGTVKVIGPDKKERVLQPNSPINLNDTIVTDGKSQAEIVFSDHTIMTFQEKSKLFVNKYEYHPEVKQGSVGTYIMNLIEGGYRTVTGAIAKRNPPDYHVDTEVAIMGVRGTDYSAAFGSCKLYMKYHSGTPILHNNKGTIVLTGQAPYAYVPSVNVAPVHVAQQPAVFNVPLNVVPATFNIKSDIKANAPIAGQSLTKELNGKPVGGGGGGSSSCAPTGGININFH